MLRLSVTGDTANRLGRNSAEVVHFSPQDSTTSMIGRSRHSLSKMFPLNPRIGRYTYIILHLLAHPGRGHTNYSTKPEPILACGCTCKLLDMGIHWSLWAWADGPLVVHHHGFPMRAPLYFATIPTSFRPGSSLINLGPIYYIVTQTLQWSLPNPRLLSIAT